MNLAIDLGNTSAKCYLFNDHTLRKILIYRTLKLPDLKKILSNYSIENSIVSSVIANDKSIKSFLTKNTIMFNLKANLPLPIKIKYHSPRTLGNDRIAAAAGAFKKFPKQNVLIIDAGTCIKYDIINARGEYLGGSISPGLLMRFKALHQFTDRLPLIYPLKTKSFIGRTTEESLLTGVQQGIINEMNGFAALYLKKFDSLKIVLTGGDAKHFASALNFPIFAVPNLTGIGLNEILLYNLL